MTETTSVSGLIAGTWNIDIAHSEITFTIRHLMSTVRGNFTDFSGQIFVAGDPFASTVIAEIEVGSIDTRNAERDAHVRSAEILDIATYPKMTFRSTGVIPARTGVHALRQRYLVEGHLTIRNVTRPVTLLTEFFGTSPDWDRPRAGFTATTSIDRSDYGVGFNIPLHGDQVLLGDRIDIQLDVQATLEA